MSVEFLESVRANRVDDVCKLLAESNVDERHRLLSYSIDVPHRWSMMRIDYAPFYWAMSQKNFAMLKVLLESAPEQDLGAMLGLKDFKAFVLVQKMGEEADKNGDLEKKAAAENLFEFLLKIAPKEIRQGLVIKCLSPRLSEADANIRALYEYDGVIITCPELIEVAKKILYEAWVSGGQDAFDSLAAMIKCEPKQRSERDKIIAQVGKKIAYQNGVNEALIAPLNKDVASIMSSMLTEHGFFQKAPKQQLTLGQRASDAISDAADVVSGAMSGMYQSAKSLFRW